MTTVLYARPYDLSAAGFYFADADQFAEKSAALRNDYGDPVEEFEIQFIDGAPIDAALAKAMGLHQGNIPMLFEKKTEWAWHEKVRFIIAVDECGHSFDPARDDIDLLDVDVYGEQSLRDLAEQFVEDGVFGEIPQRLQSYLDYDAIARDLAFDYTETEIAGTRLIYRCALADCTRKPL
ncbi:MAG: antirestriction protein ArdA [Pseudomonadota bacterium]